MRGSDRPAYPLESVDNALRLIVLMIDREYITVSESAEYLGVARSTAHRLLSMLLFRGFVVQDARRHYLPGPVFGQLDLKLPDNDQLAQRTHAMLANLSHTFDQTAHLMTLEGNGSRFIDGVEGPSKPHIRSRKGWLLPAQLTSGGKALLSELSFADLVALYPRGLPHRGLTRVRDIHALRSELMETRQRGYAVNCGDTNELVSAIAVCLRDRTGRAIAAVAIAWPCDRYPVGQESVAATVLSNHAAAMTALLD